jgi:predicted integral membrane protein DUF2269
VSAYRLVLFLHLAALLAAIGTSGLAHFAEAQLRAAETVAAARPWAALVDRAARVFPPALLALVASGAYLVQRDWAWDSSWVDAGLVGVFLLLVNGAVLVGRRNRALRRALAAAADAPLSPPLLQLTRRHVGGIASWTNTGLAIGVVFVMTTKPGLVGALATLAVAAALGSVVALRLRRHV